MTFFTKNKSKKVGEMVMLAFQKEQEQQIADLRNMFGEIAEFHKRSKLEIEISDNGVGYKHIRQLIKKICEDHEGKRDLHIKVNLHWTSDYLDSEESSDRNKSCPSECKIVNSFTEGFSKGLAGRQSDSHE